MLRKGLKVITYIIDVALFPLRTLIGLQVVVSAAILGNNSVKDGVSEYWGIIKQYPSLLVESTKVIFGEEF